MFLVSQRGHVHASVSSNFFFGCTFDVNMPRNLRHRQDGYLFSTSDRR